MREWLNAQAAGGYVDYDPTERRYTLPAEHALALADEDSPAFMPGAFQLMTASVRDEPQIREAFRTGAGVGWHEHSHGVFEGCERFFRPGYAREPRVSRGSRRWTASRRSCGPGARVADVGCGHGASTMLMAAGLSRPRRSSASTTTTGRSSGRASAPRRPASPTACASRSPPAPDFPGEGYDLVTTFDCLHDMGDPVGAARHVRESLAEDGTWLIVEPFAGDRVEDNLNPVGRVYYAASTLLCTPASLSQEVGLALGAQAGEARLRDVVTRGRLHALPPRGRDAVQPGASRPP